MNCCWLLILLYLCGGNGCGMGICGGNGCGNNCGNGNGCSNANRNDCDCGCDNERPSRPPKFPSCGCEDEMIQPHAFSGFANMGTCGCEEKNDNDNDCER